MRRSVFSLRGALTSVIGGGGMLMLAKRSIESADAIGKTADKLGLTTDALQEFRHAAKLSGVEVRTFDMAMQRFTRRAGEAAKDTGEAKAALKELGIQLFDNQGNIRSNAALLHDVADALKNTGSQTDRLRLAFKLFDSEGVAMVNMLRDGSNGLQAMRDEAQRLGIILDERLVRNAERMNNELTIASSIMDIQLSEAMINIQPLLQDVTEKIAAMARGYRNLMDEFMRSPAEITQLDVVKRKIDELAEQRIRVRKLLKANPYNAETGANKALQQELERINRSMEALQNRSIELTRAEQGSMILIGETTGIEDVSSAVETTTQSLDAMDMALDLIDKQFEDIDKNNAQVIAGFKTFGEEGEKAGDRVAKAMKSAAESIKDNIETSLTDVLMKTTTWKDAMKNIFQDVARQFIKTRISAPLTQALSGSINSLFPPRAAGGPVTAGRTYLVGEKGPELFTPAAGGNITPNNQLGGQPVNINFTVNAMDSRSFAQGMAENRNIIIGTIRQAFNRNGKAVAI